MNKLGVNDTKMVQISKGVTLLDKIQNEDMRRAIAVGDLSVKLREGRLQSFGRLEER